MKMILFSVVAGLLIHLATNESMNGCITMMLAAMILLHLGFEKRGKQVGYNEAILEVLSRERMTLLELRDCLEMISKSELQDRLDELQWSKRVEKVGDYYYNTEYTL